MAVDVYITYVGSAEMKAKKVAGIVSRAFERVILWWHKTVLAGHFKVGAAQKYGYKKRTEKWKARKLREKHIRRPLVYTGAMEAQAKRQIVLKTLKTRAEASGGLRGPRYMYMTETDIGFQHNYGRELTATTEQEREIMAKRVDVLATRDLNSMTDRRTVRT